MTYLQKFTFAQVNRFFFAMMWCVATGASTAQQFYVKQYRVERGLPSEIIKSCTQDSLGYFWIATDEGLAKYDGIRFTSYRDATHSNYTKGFFTTSTGRLLAYSDLDLIEIKNTGDTVVFKSLCPVSRIASEASLTYPKLVFEDSGSNLWISESQAVVRLHDSTFTRYPFGLSDRSPQFLRSFSFFEDRTGDLLITSFQGRVYRYNPQRDAFDAESANFPPGVEHISIVNGALIIGATEGLYKARLLPNGGFEKPKLLLKAQQVSFVTRINNNKYFIATRGTRHFIGDIEKQDFSPAPAGINNINHVYVSREGDIWLSGNEGLIMMHENLFQLANHDADDFIEAITEDPVSGTIYYATNRTLYAFDPITRQNKILLDIPDGYFQSLVFTPQGIWAANAFRVLLISNGKIKKQFDFSKNARFITALTRDAQGNIWLTIPGLPYTYTIDAALTLRRYNVPLGNEGLINMVREGLNGMYIASSGKHSYLFFKSTADTVFRNISIPIPFTPHNDFNVSDLIIAGDQIWMASSEGLLRYDRKHIGRVNLGERFTGLPVKAIAAYTGNKLLTANAVGLVLYEPSTGIYDLFNESSGLRSNTITAHGLMVSNNKNVWIGTAKGLCYSTNPLSQLYKTPTPRFTHIRAQGSKIRPQGSEIAYGSFLSFQASSITFPENEINLQYRVLPHRAWKTATDTELSLTATDVGEQTLEIRAKKNGPYAWSDPARLTFIVGKPFWRENWFFLLCFIAAAVLVTATITGVNALHKIRNRELQMLVHDRTLALQRSNQKLINLNLEKNNLIGIVAHDLKSPLNQIKGLLSIVRLAGKVDEESGKYLGMIDTSVARLNDMIMKILDVDAIESKRLNLKMEKVSLSELCNTVADRYRSEASRKNIAIAKLIDPEVFVTVDRNYTEQILENLLSNAIKFSPHNRHIYITLRTQGNKAMCEIKDEGPGLSDEDKKKLFGKYQKLSAQPTGNETSTGLGLSIVKKFVVAMNGEISCHSEAGKGACFIVAFVRV